MKKEAINAIIDKNIKDIFILDITYKNGRGKMKIDLFNLLPCPAHDFKILLDTIQIADDAEKTASELYDYIRVCIDTLKDYRALLADYEKKDIASVTNEIKRYINLAEKVAKRFDFEPISDAENVKMSKTEVVTMLCIDGKPALATFPGKRFEKGGYIFHVYKEKGRYKDVHIIMPYCGVAVTSYTGAVKDAPAYIDEKILDQLGELGERIETARQQFLDLLADRPGIIQNDDINVDPLEKLETEPEITKEPDPVKEEIAAVVNAPIPADTSEDTPIYTYGMRMRGFSIGCQPKDGFTEWLDDTTGKYWDIITYDRPLTPQEIEDYELDDLITPHDAPPHREMARRACIVRMLTQPTRQEPQRKSKLPNNLMTIKRTTLTITSNGTLPELKGKPWLENMNRAIMPGKWHDTS